MKVQGVDLENDFENTVTLEINDNTMSSEVALRLMVCGVIYDKMSLAEYISEECEAMQTALEIIAELPTDKQDEFFDKLVEDFRELLR